jgi:hypothetical protein
VTGQRLHLLVLSLDSGSGGEDLKKEVLASFEATHQQGDIWTAPAFRNIRASRPLSGAALRFERIHQELLTIGKWINKLKKLDEAPGAQPANDLVLIYYAGKESVGPKGNHIFHTADAPSGLGEPITFDAVAEILGRTPGAHLLFLDVERTPLPGERAKDEVVHLYDDFPDLSKHVAILRWAWLAPPDVPGKDSLMGALTTSLLKKRQLEEVTEAIRIQTVQSPNTKKLRFDTSRVQAPLKTLPIGQDR